MRKTNVRAHTKGINLKGIEAELKHAETMQKSQEKEWQDDLDNQKLHDEKQKQPLTKKAQTEKEAEEARQDLLKMIKSDLDAKRQPVFYTTLKNVSSSGMMRHIDVFYIGEDKKPVNINWYIEKMGLYKRGKNYNDKNADSLRVSGAGMDMGFSVVYNLGERLFKNDAAKYDIHTNRNGDPKPENSGGYIVKQEWL